MPQGLPFCPHCGARQIKAGARFCHACGRPIPAVTLQPAAPPEFPPARRRRLNPWWLLPPLLAVALAAAALAWEPARTRVSVAFAAVRERVTGARGTSRSSFATALAAASADAPVVLADPPAGAAAVEATTTPRAPLPTATPPPTATPLPPPTPQPTATPRPTATPLPTPTPQPTPTPSPTVPPESSATPTAVACPIPVDGLFRTIWAQEQPRLGCPVRRAATSYAATERFQYGRMIWRETDDMIYVLYDDGDWALYADIYQEGAPEPGLFQPPPELYVPVRGFGAIWHARLGGADARIGWAVEPEYAVSVFAQNFERGVMLEMEGVIYLLGDDGGLWWMP